MKNTIKAFGGRALFLICCAAVLHLPLSTIAQTPNQVLALNGTTDYVSIPSASDLQNPTEITVEAWVYPRNKGSDFVVLMKGDGGSVNSSRTYEIDWHPADGGAVFFGVFLGATTLAMISAPAPAEKWVHVAGSYSSADSVLRIYTNGVLAGESQIDAGGVSPLNHQLIRQTSEPLVLGTSLQYHEGFAFVEIDEVRVWGKARTAVEILRDCYRRLTGAESSLAGYWTFDDGTARDISGHGHTGAFGGTPRTILADLPLPPTPRQARATATVLSGFVSKITVTDPGYGYTNSPTVTISGDGVGASAVALLDGTTVSQIIVTRSGTGYSTAPKIIIDPPFTTPSLAIRVGSVVVTMSVIEGRKYLLESSIEMTTWKALGSPFVAQSDKVESTFEVGSTGQFFRISEVP